MRRFTLSLLLLALAARADDKADARQEAVDKIASKVAQMDRREGDVFKLMDEVRDLSDTFSAANAPAGGALAIASTDGKLVLVSGGKCTKDGVTIVASKPPKGRSLRLRGGDGGPSGHAGRSASWDERGMGSKSGANGAGTGGGRGGSFSAASGGTSVSGSTGANGTDAEAGRNADFPSEDEMDAIVADVESIESAWDDEAKRKSAIEALEKHRPSKGVVAAYSSDGKLFVLLGANGDDRNPDGVSVEAAGKLADRVVAIAGDKGKGGKAGTAKAPEGGTAVNGK